MAVNIVQFTHPGGQPTLTKAEKNSGIKEWNTKKDHFRRFLIAEGQYLKDSILTNPQDLLFWGEWEPTSKIKASFSPIDPILYPTYLHSPFLQLNKKGKIIKPVSTLKIGGTSSCLGKPKPNCSPFYGLFQNTDPFVFADSFLYSLCKQDRFTSLRGLDVGSIILFGSTIYAKHGGPYFALDTVFVVGEKQTYTAKTYKADLGGFIPQYYDDIMEFNTCGNNIQFTCYKGATFNNPINGMYSFVPCKTTKTGNGGFPRAKLTAKDFKSVNIPGLAKYKKNPYIITDNLNSAPKVIASDIATNKQIWGIICKTIASQGYLQGMNFKYQVI